MSYRLYHTVTFGLTNQCNANCDYCIVECNSTNKHHILEESVILRSLQELSKARNIKTVAFTGGEAFLDYPKLQRLVCAVNKINKKSAVYTNGFWCKSPAVTREKLTHLKSLGLERLLTSIDSEHQKFVPVENMRNLLNVCQELNIPISVHSVVNKSTLKETLHILEELAEDLIGITVTTSSVMLIGSAKKAIAKEEIYSKVNIKNIRCSYDQMAYVNSLGNVYPCCTGNVPDNLCLGNIYDENILTCLDRAFENIFFKAILKNGMSWIMEIAARENIIDASQTYSSECEVCVELLQCEQKKELLFSVIERELEHDAS